MSQGLGYHMKPVAILLATALFLIGKGLASESKAVEAELVAFFKEKKSQPIDFDRFAELIKSLFKSSAQSEYISFFTISSEPEYDFVTAIYENVPFDNEKLYEKLSSLPIFLKVHHLYTICRICDHLRAPFSRLYETTTLFESA